MLDDIPPSLPLAASTTPATIRCLVIGIGNEYHGDDAIGLEVARRIRAAGLSGVAVRECTGNIVEFLDSWHDYDLVVLVDAVQSGSPPGTVFRFDAGSQAMAKGAVRQVSSHGVGVADSIELARTLDRLPRTLILYGVEGGMFELGAGLTPEVEMVMDEVADRIVTELRSPLSPR